MKTYINNIFNRKSIRYLLLSGLTIFSLQACKKDFLDIPPQGSLTSAIYPTTASDALRSVNAVYDGMRNWNYNSGGFPILDIMSDQANKGSNPGDAARLDLFDNFSFTATISDLYPWYSAIYQAVKWANVVLVKVPDISMDNALKTRYLAEAHFLRAYFYFDLVRAWGDVPKVITLEPPQVMPRSPKSEIYNEIIIPDLMFAIDNLPEQNSYDPSDRGRASKGAARALLGKVYLYQKDFQNAEKYELEVINSGQYSLMPNFSDAFSLAGQFGSESVFELGALPFENNSQGGNQYANTQGVRGIPNKGWGFNRPSLALINSYEAGDLRKDATVIFLGETIDGVYIQGDNTTPDTTYSEPGHKPVQIECYNQKVWVPGTTTVDEWGYNIRYIRYADVLLMAAEALNENGKATDALTYLNEVRTRAGLEDITTTNKDSLRNKIYDERNFELAMEGQRFYDLVRTGRAEQVLGPLGFVKGKNELLPIPQTEIDLSGGVLTQNPGW